jgi:hypothetical protein
VKIDPKAVRSFRRVGSPEDLRAREAELRENASVTLLIELDLKANLLPRRDVAVVTLHYSDAAGRPARAVRKLKAADLRGEWDRATQRHRLATLGALWGESLKREDRSGEVAVRAAELARQAPGNSRARDLATAASAFFRLRSSSPTGSGR